MLADSTGSRLPCARDCLEILLSQGLSPGAGRADGCLQQQENWERKGRGWGRVKSVTPLVFINNCFLLKRQIPLAPGELYWAVKKAIDHMWVTGPIENKHQFQVFLCTLGRDRCVFPGHVVDGRQTQPCSVSWGNQGLSGLQKMSKVGRGISSLIDPLLAGGSCSKPA